MKLTIHVPSALAGAGLLGLALVATSAQKPLTYKHPTAIEVTGVPLPEDLVSVLDKTGVMQPNELHLAFEVPADRWFVLSDGWSDSHAYFNTVWLGQGGVAAKVVGELPQKGNPDNRRLGPGIAFEPGSQVLIENTFFQGTTDHHFALYGYLVDA